MANRTRDPTASPASPVTEFLALYRELLGRNFPVPIMGRAALEQHGSGLIGTFGLHTPLLDMGARREFRGVPPGFLQLGFWGHGLNSHAFYFCEVTDRRRVFMRLPFGGAYMNPETQRLFVTSVMDAYVEVDRLSGASGLARLTAIDWMGEGKVAARFTEGSEASVELDGVPGSGFARVLTAPRSKGYRGKVPERRA